MQKRFLQISQNGGDEYLVLKINILSGKLRNVRVTVTEIMNETFKIFLRGVRKQLYE